MRNVREGVDLDGARRAAVPDVRSGWSEGRRGRRAGRRGRAAVDRAPGPARRRGGAQTGLGIDGGVPVRERAPLRLARGPERLWRLSARRRLGRGEAETCPRASRALLRYAGLRGALVRRRGGRPQRLPAVRGPDDLLQVRGLGRRRRGRRKCGLPAVRHVERVRGIRAAGRFRGRDQKDHHGWREYACHTGAGGIPCR